MVDAYASPALTVALDLAARGFPCFPLHANKRPATEHGFQEATSDPSELRALWRRCPGPLVGVPTGSISGFDVLDLDLPRHAEAGTWWGVNRGRFPATRTHRTRSGGLHLLLRHAPGLRCSAGKLAVGVDVRADGGFIVWWPASGFAVLTDVPHAEWPTEVLSALRPSVPVWRPSPRSGPPPMPEGSKNATRPYAVTALRRAVERVASAPEGQRNTTLNAECYSLARLVPTVLSVTELAESLAVAAGHAGLTPAETIRTLASALRAGGAA